jgi:hypothetical protein
MLKETNEKCKHGTGQSIVFTNSEQSPPPPPQAPSVCLLLVVKVSSYDDLFTYA